QQVHLRIPRLASKAHQPGARLCGARNFGVSAAARVANFGGVLLHKVRLIPREQISVICAGIVVSLLPYFFPLDGKPHADWLQFLGRFHPLLVHLPIGLVALFPVLEFMGARRPAMREAAGFVLLIALAACFISIFFGLLLAYGSGENGSTVTYHMRGAI